MATISTFPAYRGFLGRAEFFDYTAAPDGSFVEAGSGDDYVFSSGGRDFITGGGGSDYIRTLNGNDVIFGDLTADDPIIPTDPVGVRPAADAINAGAGNDVIFASAGNDYVNAEQDADYVDGGSGNDVLYGGDGADYIVGGNGDDEIWGGTPIVLRSTYVPSITVSFDGTTNIAAITPFTVGTAIISAGATASADTSADTLIGGNGDDQIHGNAGNDQIEGGGGNDHLWGDAGTDYLSGGDGFDYARYDFSATGVLVRLDDQATNTGEGGGDYFYSIEGLIGSDFNDTLIGAVDGNTILGLAGNDEIHGLAGGDALLGGDGQDQLFGGEGTDFIDGGAGFDIARYDFAGAGVAVNLSTGSGTAGEAAGDFLLNIEGLVGSFHSDFLVGNAEANTIFGQAGDDVIFGSEGADTLNGGIGNDTFAFRFVDFAFGLYDHIADFQQGVGNFDALTLIDVRPEQIRLFDTPNGVLVTSTAVNLAGGVIIEGFSVAALQDQIFFV